MTMIPMLVMTKTNDENKERNWFMELRLQFFYCLSNEPEFSESLFYEPLEFEC